MHRFSTVGFLRRSRKKKKSYPDLRLSGGRNKAKKKEDAEAYADDGYIKAKLSVALEVLSDIKQVLKEDAGLALNDKTQILVKGYLGG